MASNARGRWFSLSPGVPQLVCHSRPFRHHVQFLNVGRSVLSISTAADAALGQGITLDPSASASVAGGQGGSWAIGGGVRLKGGVPLGMLVCADCEFYAISDDAGGLFVLEMINDPIIDNESCRA